MLVVYSVYVHIAHPLCALIGNELTVVYGAVQPVVGNKLHGWFARASPRQHHIKFVGGRGRRPASEECRRRARLN